MRGTDRMFIGDVARLTGVGIEALRFYEKERHSRAECPVLVGIETEIHSAGRGRHRTVEKESQE